MIKRNTELAVGGFLLAGMIAFLVLVFKVADIDPSAHTNVYKLTAQFDNIGSLKERSPVKVGGVVVGRVTAIDLDPELLLPVVTMAIESRFDQFTDSSSASILTSGLLGEQYIGITPGFMDDESELLADGDRLEDTRSAVVLEELIGQFLYSMGKEG
ncbi:outer membrane lipid asymmetry maintenance protein MlaD [Ferrimonas aestuarii]|uniref:Outer membrane lipid asymmetry maintenance protein MlaD n=1 Tax=Ferrimonas aestuarii TaxID=2569539 RepID=A0A4U1BPT1_9GAMM|nr:outer membrane lipid asymmetry maintenance protein MlaD [Ferrimonas aestuarii]TKB55960.1 outer membrane lipid asymmetry maintenance protein MlaD [Ferrimonas aestuarii]